MPELVPSAIAGACQVAAASNLLTTIETMTMEIALPTAPGPPAAAEDLFVEFARG